MELKVTVPTTLSEITLDQYQRFARLQGDEEFLTHKMLEIFCGLPLADLPNVRIKSVSHITKHINGMLAEKPNLKPTFTLGEQTFGFIPELDNITYGEFVDLDTYLQDVQNMHKAMAVLYRPITQQVKSRYLIEPYESAGKYAEQMKQAPMDVVLGGVLFFLAFRERTIAGYSELFGGEETDDYSRQGQFAKRWGWYTTVYQLAQGDIRRFAEITRLELHECLHFLTFEKQKQEAENDILKSKMK